MSPGARGVSRIIDDFAEADRDVGPQTDADQALQTQPIRTTVAAM